VNSYLLYGKIGVQCLTYSGSYMMKREGIFGTPGIRNLYILVLFVLTFSSYDSIQSKLLTKAQQIFIFLVDVFCKHLAVVT
jgi:hypothetical protein